MVCILTLRYEIWGSNSNASYMGQWSGFEFMNVSKSIHGIESKLKQEELITEGQAMEE